MAEPLNKLRILLVTRNFPPLTGGMERLMLNVARGLAEWSELTIVGPQGCREHCPRGVKVYETPVNLAPFLAVSLWQAIKACRRDRFQIIMGGSGLTAPAVGLLKLVCGAKSIVFIHGLDLVVGSVIYQSIFLPFIRRADLVIANSQNTRKIAVTKQVPKARIMVINPGTELPDISAIKSGEDFCQRHNIPFKKIMIFIGRMTRRKGLSRFIENSLPAILEAEPESGLVVVGNDPHQSLTDSGEMKEILAAAKRLHLEHSIIFLGNVSDDELLACYATADVQIFPLIEVSDDIEGFGMVAIEAAACGTPTAAFAVGGVGDAISEKNGLLIRPDDYDSFTSGVITILQTGQPSAAACMDHASNFDWSIYNAKLKTALQPLPFTNPGNWDYPPVA